jgi:hypothetical protein
MWAQCPHRWKTAYVDEQREYSDSIFTMFGTSMHEVIQTFLTVMYNDTAKLAEQLPLEDMLRTRMKRNFEQIVEANGGEMFCSIVIHYCEKGLNHLVHRCSKHSENTIRVFSLLIYICSFPSVWTLCPH